MADYIDFPITADPSDLAQEAFDYLQTQVDGWLPAPGNIETIIIEANARMAAELAVVASAVPLSIFRYFGSKLIGLPPIDATPASVNSTWTMRDNAGYTIPAGTTVGIPASGDVLVPFQVQSDVLVPVGSTATAAGAVVLVAVTPGAAGSGLSGTPALVDALDYVTTIALTGVTTGGVDAEDNATYLDRLSNELALLAPRPILANDFAVYARNTPGVDRAMALDGYNPADSSSGNARMVAVAVVDANGQPVSSGIKAQVDASLQATREVNFIINIIDPTYTAVSVTFTVHGYTGFDPTDLQTRVIAAIRDFLSPANWGLPRTGDVRGWVNTPQVRYLDVAAVIHNVEGVNYISALTINGGTADVALAGAAPMPTVGTVTGTAVVP